MPLTRRKLRPRLVRFLHRQLESPRVSEEHKTAIAKVLNDDTLLDSLGQQVRGLTVAQNAPEVAAAVGATGDHPFLEWLTAHWTEILAMILKLLGV